MQQPHLRTGKLQYIICTGVKIRFKPGKELKQQYNEGVVNESAAKF